MNRRPAEAGSTMVMAILMMVVVGVIIGVLTTRSVGGARESAHEQSRVTGLPVADAAIARVRSALDLGLISDADGHGLSASDWAVVGEDATLLPATSPQVPAELRPDPAYPLTVRETIDGDRVAGYWQILRIIPPTYADATSSDVVAYLRVWTGDGVSGGTRTSRVIKVRYAAGSLSRYQLLTHSPLRTGPMSISGPIHSNGRVAEGAADAPAIEGGGATCVGDPRVSSGRGTITGITGGCSVEPAVGREVPIGPAVDRAIGIASSRCDQPDDLITCVGRGTSLPAGASYRVTIGSTSVSWSCSDPACPAGSSGSMPIPSMGAPVELPSTRMATGAVLVVFGTAEVQGATRGRLTVVVGEDSTGASKLRIAGTTGAVSSPGSILGLVAPGSVEVAGCPSTIAAAIASGGASLGIDGNTRDACPGALTVFGAVAARTDTQLSLAISPTVVAGYGSRTISFDPRLRHEIPTFFPLASAWSADAWTEGEPSCVGPTPEPAPQCR